MDLLNMLFGWISGEDFGEVSLSERVQNTKDKANRHKRERLDTNIRPDLGEDKSTSSGYVERSTPMKPKSPR